MGGSGNPAWILRICIRFTRIRIQLFRYQRGFECRPFCAKLWVRIRNGIWRFLNYNDFVKNIASILRTGAGYPGSGPAFRMRIQESTEARIREQTNAEPDPNHYIAAFTSGSDGCPGHPVGDLLTPLVLLPQSANNIGHPIILINIQYSIVPINQCSGSGTFAWIRNYCSGSSKNWKSR